MTKRGSAPNPGRIIGLFPELLGVGGIQEAGRLTAAALQEIAQAWGWSADFLSLNDSPGEQSFNAGERRIVLRGFGRAKVGFALAGLNGARSPRNKVGRIVLAAHPYLAVPASWMQRLDPNLKTIVMAHGVEVWKPLPSYRRKALLRANLVVAPSRDTSRKLFEVQGVAEERIRTLPWPISPSFLTLTDFPGSLPLPIGFPQGLVILTVGRWAAAERYKGADELIRSVAALRVTFPDLHLVAVGGGDDLPRLQKFAVDLGIGNCVHFFEKLSREEVAACYARADLFALPSTGEGFGLVFLEAMAFSKAVAGVACGGATDVIEDGINGLLVPPNDHNALTQALGRLLRDESFRGNLGRRGAKMVRTKYQFQVFRASLERILRDCRLDEGSVASDSRA